MAGGEPAGGLSNGEGSRADARENRSGVVDRVRPLPIRGSCRRQHDAARGPAPPVVKGEAPKAIGPRLELAEPLGVGLPGCVKDTQDALGPMGAHDSRR